MGFDSKGAAGGAAAGAQTGSMIMPGWGTAIGAVAGGIMGGFMGGGEKPVPSFKELLGPFFGVLKGKGEDNQNFKDAISNMVKFLKDPSVPDSVRRRTMAGITSAFQNAKGIAAKQAATTGGVFSLGPAAQAFSVGRLQAGAEASFAQLDINTRLQANSQINAIQSFLGEANAIRAGIPQAQSRTASVLSGALKGASIGTDYGALFSKPTAPTNLPPGEWQGPMLPGEPRPGFPMDQP